LAEQVLQIDSTVEAGPGHQAGAGSVSPAPVRLMNVCLDRITEARCIAEIVAGIREGRGGWVITLNVDHLRRCWSDATYESCVQEADLRVADGMPLIWASRLQRTPLPQRIAGSDLIFKVSEALAPERRRVYLLGGDPGTAEAAGKVLRSRYPGLEIAGAYCPPFGYEKDPAEMRWISDSLRASGPDLVYVALGSPKQEYLIRQMRPLLPRAWWMGVGISFSFVCGQVKRAPGWMQRTGLEWIHRMWQEPKRLAGRYLVQGLPFGAFLLLGSAMRRQAS
jgi:N-acetylglucosaminyldiphosphoundecaprenol N-acetyl-beta-D-mannosaminyltransferase